MNNITSGIANMSVRQPTTPRNQGTRPQNLQPQRTTVKNTGKGGPGKKLHFGYQNNTPGGKRKKRKKKSRKRKKSRKGGRRKSRKTRKSRKRKRRRRR